MGRIPIIQKDQACLGQDNDTLPTWYMADYSVLAIIVDKLEAAIRILYETGIPVIEASGERTVEFSDPAGLNRIVALLKDHAIELSLSDSVTRIYQG